MNNIEQKADAAIRLLHEIKAEARSPGEGYRWLEAGEMLLSIDQTFHSPLAQWLSLSGDAYIKGMPTYAAIERRFRRAVNSRTCFSQRLLDDTLAKNKALEADLCASLLSRKQLEAEVHTLRNDVSVLGGYKGLYEETKTERDRLKEELEQARFHFAAAQSCLAHNKTLRDLADVSRSTDNYAPVGESDVILDGDEAHSLSGEWVSLGSYWFGVPVWRFHSLVNSLQGVRRKIVRA